MKDIEMVNRDSQISILVICSSNPSCSIMRFMFTLAKIFIEKTERQLLTVCRHMHSCADSHTQEYMHMFHDFTITRYKISLSTIEKCLSDFISSELQDLPQNSLSKITFKTLASCLEHLGSEIISN